MATELSESVANTVENIACHVAQRKGGRVTPSTLLPYLPVSLGMVRECLEEMAAEGMSVAQSTENGIDVFEFPAYRDADGTETAAQVDACVGCRQTDRIERNELLCDRCREALDKEISRLAEKTAWPAEAVYEHELLHAASKFKDAVPPEKLAAVTRFTLRGIRPKLKQLALGHYASEEFDESAATLKYGFPGLDYPDERYADNMATIRSFPASVTEEVQLKVTRILLTLGCMFLGMLVLAFLRVPFPLLVLGFIVAAPITAISIWRRKEKVIGNR